MNKVYTIGTQGVEFKDYKVNVNIQMFGKENKAPKSKLPDDFNGDLQSYIGILYDHQKLCEKNGKYIEADLAKKKLLELRQELQKKTKQQMKSKHQSQKTEVEKAHVEQFNEFNSYWDKKLQEFETEAIRIQEQTRKKHEQETAEFQDSVQKALGPKPKQTSQMINLRKIQESLAKQEDYREAHKVQQKLSELEKQEYERWNFAKVNKVKNLLQQLHQKQENELNVLQQRIETGYEEQKKQRAMQLEKLLQKYQNFMKELENQHHQQIIRFDKATKLQTNNSLNVSKMSNMSRTKS